MTPVALCVHNTANDAAAKGEISYMVGNNSQTSFHFAVDDIEVWQGLPLDRNGWHAGDGNGEGNRKTIGIEICYSLSGGARFTKAEDNAATLIAQLLKERKWGIEKVKKHQDYSGKYCPHRTLDLGWDRFLKMVQLKLGANDMPTELEVCMTDRKKFWEERDIALGQLVSVKADRDRYRKERDSARDEVTKLTEDLAALKEELEACQTNSPAPISGEAPEVLGWVNNGLQIKVGDKTWNYSKK
jgi:N-acetylmuramoyl-L-alanine amidase CwlA